jgi:hypothetical protein
MPTSFPERLRFLRMRMTTVPAMKIVAIGMRYLFTRDERIGVGWVRATGLAGLKCGCVEGILGRAECVGVVFELCG